ncbi:hypothetical protein [Bartonella sp. HY406]|uniref:hypothetical protein n=1 Tax=Bartonella sp. HY406 TaxID=2979331 RepID=UPI0021C6B40C|nr:hypothetical protein [Bartonella sp. HY406]UXN04966.1 hypothetical protein N6B01_13890 [Bartonella sp. HY406]
MEIVSRIFKYFDTTYLLRNYIWAIIGTVICIFLAIYLNDIRPLSMGINIVILVIILMNLILFPFAKLVWGYVEDLFFGAFTSDFDLDIWTVLALIVRVIVNLFLFSIAFIIAPIGIAYIVFKNKRDKNKQAD